MISENTFLNEGEGPALILKREKNPNRDFKEAIRQIREESVNIDISMEEILEEIAKYVAGQ